MKKRCGHQCSNPGVDCCICFQNGTGKGQCLSCNERERLKMDINQEYEWIKKNIVQITIEKLHYQLELNEDGWNGHEPIKSILIESKGFFCNSCNIYIYNIIHHFTSHRIEGLCEGCDEFVGKETLTKILTLKGGKNLCAKCLKAKWSKN